MNKGSYDRSPVVMAEFQGMREDNKGTGDIAASGIHLQKIETDFLAGEKLCLWFFG